MEAGSARALIMLACLIWRRDGRDADAAWQDVLSGELDFDLNEMLGSMAKAAEDAQKEAEAEKNAASPTPAGSAPAGSPTTGSGTPASSPSTSVSARGKSASSRSKTSRPLSTLWRNTS